MVLQTACSLVDLKDTFCSILTFLFAAGLEFYSMLLATISDCVFCAAWNSSIFGGRFPRQITRAQWQQKSFHGAADVFGEHEGSGSQYLAWWVKFGTQGNVNNVQSCFYFAPMLVSIKPAADAHFDCNMIRRQWEESRCCATFALSVSGRFRLIGIHWFTTT